MRYDDIVIVGRPLEVVDEIDSLVAERIQIAIHDGSCDGSEVIDRRVSVNLGLPINKHTLLNDLSQGLQLIAICCLRA